MSTESFSRTHYCGTLTEKEIGSSVTVMGWAAKRRDFGGLIFIDLRDRTGILQVVFDASQTNDFEKAEAVRNEYVLKIEGKLRRRSDDTINPKLKTGMVEVVAHSIQILADADTPPFTIGDSQKVNEAVRLKYRYLDMREGRLLDNLRLRSDMMQVVRSYLVKNGFLEIETPCLGKSTPEGARDYLVPSRIRQGSFYALPQSPQLYKQLLMIGGADKYFQIARCFRDEDLRANRQPEFTQIDIEASFLSQDEIMELSYGLIRDLFNKCGGIKLPKKIRKMPYDEAMSRFGSDKPDTRFGLELTDISDIARNCGFQVFEKAVASGGSVRMINAKGFVKENDPILSRRDIDALTDFVKTYRAKGLAWIAIKADGVQSVITKFMPDEVVKEILKRANAQEGDILFFCADSNSVVFQSLGALRLHLADIANLIDKNTFDVLWVVDFPMFEYSEEEKRYQAQHHPFTMMNEQDIQYLDKPDELARIRTKTYDLVINGEEAGGGSIRIHDRNLQKKVFNALGFSEQQIQDNFGFFVDAFNYGAPPHGGLAFGLDRLVMMLAHTENIKDVIAFPKVQNASDLLTQAPSEVAIKQLNELGIKLKPKA